MKRKITLRRLRLSGRENQSQARIDRIPLRGHIKRTAVMSRNLCQKGLRAREAAKANRGSKSASKPAWVGRASPDLKLGEALTMHAIPPDVRCTFPLCHGAKTTWAT